jgi:LysR family transcriptional regulator, transcriptional activator for dmlA
MRKTSDLAFFAAVAKAGTLSAAARELDVSPPAVSKRLAQLERRLGVRLMHRTTRRISLTAEGEVYVETGRRILSELEELESQISSARAAPKGLLRVNATLGFGRTYVAPLVSAFRRRYPEVEVLLQLTDRPVSLTDEAFDVGIRFGDLPDARIVARKIANNRRLLCAAPGYLDRHGRPATPADLTRHDCIVLRQNDSGFGLWRLLRGRKSEPIKVRGPLSSNDGSVVLGWALDGHGVLMRAEWEIADHLRAGRLEQVLPEYALPPADIYAVYPERHHLSARVRVFVGFLVERFREYAERGPVVPSRW